MVTPFLGTKYAVKAMNSIFVATARWLNCNRRSGGRSCGRLIALENKKGHLPEQVTFFIEFGGVADGARTHDNRNHKPSLYKIFFF
jgi:hypothetical protein